VDPDGSYSSFRISTIFGIDSFQIGIRAIRYAQWEGKLVHNYFTTSGKKSRGSNAPYSTTPLSQAGPTCRAAPRWSVAGQPDPLSLVGLSA